MATRRTTGTVLLIEDNREMVALVTRVLRDEHLAVRSAPDGESGIAAARTNPPDLIVLDIGLPGMSGLDAVEGLRGSGITVPILMVTARGSTTDRVAGLDAGADDYLPKPFEPAELVARVRALLRGSALRSKGARVVVADMVLDPIAREVYCAGQRVPLTQREFDLLHVLMRNAGRTVSRAEIAEAVWGQPAGEDTSNIVEVYVAYLRRKLAEAEGPSLRTVRGPGGGYRLDAS